MQDAIKPLRDEPAALSAETWLSGPSQTVIESVRESSKPSSVYWLMNGLPSVIASYGLLADSPAVVTGAMVVAMLRGPISGVALGLNQGDARLLATAGRTLAGGVLWILAVALAVGFIHRDAPLTSEILSRTDTRLFDVIIALAGGAAGAVAVLSPRVGTAIVGVAVATALAPTLAVAGLLAARADFERALMLAATNVIGIQFAFSVVFWVGGYRQFLRIADRGSWGGRLPALNDAESRVPRRARRLLGLRLHAAIARSLYESKVEAALRQSFEPIPGYYLASVRFGAPGAPDAVVALVRGRVPVTAEEVVAAERRLPPPPDGQALHLRVHFVRTLVMTPQGAIDDKESAE
jgi:uncharacterized hydrophobic protein (TIGR00271 family)